MRTATCGCTSRRKCNARPPHHVQVASTPKDARQRPTLPGLCRADYEEENSTSTFHVEAVVRIHSLDGALQWVVHASRKNCQFAKDHQRPNGTLEGNDLHANIHSHEAQHMQRASKNELRNTRGRTGASQRLFLRATIVSAMGASETTHPFWQHLTTALPHVQRSRVPRIQTTTSRARGISSCVCDMLCVVCLLFVVICVHCFACALWRVLCEFCVFSKLSRKTSNTNRKHTTQNTTTYLNTPQIPHTTKTYTPTTK